MALEAPAADDQQPPIAFTPPFGINLFVGQAVFRLPLAEICRGTLPFIAAAIAALAVVSYVPQLSLALVRWLY
ncbi:TRAP transporter large permease subunit [Ramlibacter rhizophilus]|uniref:TRAP transporter large permease subunit n=1 Tax=Ramlibacter rhizophilus TaxID=1781167 RepID=A0A4Z0BEQ4_9BURK|nr:TRAP transporter large permease subunit [Ramlibacter rhizophilus]TFY97792.1 TRAP transporter large permease subunit [Ramlibacter rhizophilus]